MKCAVVLFVSYLVTVVSLWLQGLEIRMVALRRNNESCFLVLRRKHNGSKGGIRKVYLFFVSKCVH